MHNKFNILKQQQYSYVFTEYQSVTELEEAQKKLLLQAQSVLNNAYAPYSNFKVGAAVLTADGNIFEGVNIENASYPVGICAERSALSALISKMPKSKILKIAISYLSGSGKSAQPIYPCGMCRQFIVECENRNQAPIELILAGMEGNIHIVSSAALLLPFGFNKDSLM